MNIQILQKYAQDRGGKCLSVSYNNQKEKLLWQCKNGHEWSSSPNNLFYKGQWCPQCAFNINSSKLRLGIIEMQKIAKERGGRCLSRVYKNNQTKLIWECSDGHKWKAVPASIKLLKTWCPTCSEGLGENLCRLTLKEIFNKNFVKVRPKWLTIENGSRLELDGFNNELKLAFEYQGQQHYLPSSFHNPSESGEYKLKKLKARDTVKKQKCKNLGIKIIEVPYWIELQTIPDYIYSSIDRMGINNELIINRSVSFADINIYDKGEIRKLIELAKQKGGKCLSKVYLGNGRKLEWECRNGHRWEAAPGSIKSGSWCAVCAGIIVKNITDANELAIKKGGKCLSTFYKNAHTKLLWQCKEAHEWEASYHHIDNGTWCPTCAGKNPITMNEIHKIARSRGGDCLSEVYVSGEKLLWRCAEGHEWRALIINVKNKKSWCPVCYKNNPNWRKKSPAL